MTTYDAAFDALIGNEGSYSNNPADPGGETMWGITARVARAHNYAGAMRDLPRDTAKAIAKSAYWDVARGDDLPGQVAFQVFDALFNGGPAIRWLQQAVGAKPDGVLGPATLAAVNAAPVMTTVARFDACRLAYLADLPTWPTFGRGWAHRIANNLLKAAA